MSACVWCLANAQPRRTCSVPQCCHVTRAAWDSVVLAPSASPLATRMQTAPEETQAFPGAVAQGRLGFLLFHFQPAHLQSERLLSFLERIVMLPDKLQHRITSCKLLVRTMVRRRLCHMREELLPAQARAADAEGSGRLSHLPAT